MEVNEFLNMVSPLLSGTTSVYALWDPVLKEPYWVGVSDKPSTRFKDHCTALPSGKDYGPRVVRTQALVSAGYQERDILLVLAGGLLRQAAVAAESALIRKIGTIKGNNGPLLNSPDQRLLRKASFPKAA